MARRVIRIMPEVFLSNWRMNKSAGSVSGMLSAYTGIAKAAWDCILRGDIKIFRGDIYLEWMQMGIYIAHSTCNMEGFSGVIDQDLYWTMTK